MGRLFFRIFLWFWLGTTCLLLVLAIGLWIFQPDFLDSFRFMRQSAMRYVGARAVSAYEQRGRSGADVLLADIAREAGFRSWLYSADAELLAGGPPIRTAGELVARALANNDMERARRFGPPVFARRIDGDSGKPYVIVWETRFRLSQLVSPVQLSMRLIALILTGGLLCWWLTWQITKPIEILRRAASRFAVGDLAVRVGNNRELRRGDELSELARDFDQMAIQIGQLMKSQQQLLADISHELRSPLARLSLALELARRRLGEGVPEHQRMEREIHRLNELIEHLLTLARLEEQSKRPESETVNLRELVHEVAADARFEAEVTGRKVVVAPAADTTVRGSRALLRSALENVVRNAVRHTPEAREVTIELERMDEAHRLRIRVRDCGPGVPPEALEHLFDPFFRVEEGRDRKRGGVGLGLAITRQAVLTHGGTVIAQNHPEGGLLVQLELPTD